MITTKPCSRCKKTKPLDEFSIDRSAKSGLQSNCKSCASTKAKEWNKTHPRNRLDQDRKVIAANDKSRNKATRHGNPWTQWEDEVLRNNFGRTRTRDIAEGLGRTIFAVKYRVGYLGIKARTDQSNTNAHTRT